jgi:hypothetical protein
MLTPLCAEIERTQAVSQYNGQEISSYCMSAVQISTTQQLTGFPDLGREKRRSGCLAIRARG